MTNIPDDPHEALYSHAEMERAWLAGHGHAWQQIWGILDRLGFAGDVQRATLGDALTCQGGAK